MPAAVAVPLIAGAAGAGASLYGAKKASDTARAAGATQADAANRAAELEYQAQQDALRFMRDEAAMMRQDQAPYRALGAGAVNSLAHLTGIPMGGGSPQAPAPQPAMGSGMPTGPTPPFTVRPPAALPSAADTKRARITGAPNMAGLGAHTVQMMAPNGEVEAVPMDQVAHFEKLGAKRVG